MKLALSVAVVVLAMAVGTASQAYFYGVDPAPSMYAAQVGAGAMPLMNEQGQPIPAAPSMDAIMAGNAMAAPYVGNPQMASGFAPAPAFVEAAQPIAAAAPAPYATEESHVADEAEEEDAEEADEADEAEEADEEAEEGEEADSEEAEDDMRFAEKRGNAKGKSGKGKGQRKGKGKSGKGKGKGKGGKGKGKGKGKSGKGKKFARDGSGKRFNPKNKPLFKPKMGKPKKTARSPSVKTPKAAGGRKLPPMPAPLPKAPKIDCKKNPSLCVDAETPAEGETPGDHSPKAVFKKKMEVIKKSLLKNNRNIAQESKWIDQVEAIMKQYALKVKKVKEHIGDERKAIKELLRQRRIILNEKKQKELELKLKMATTELAALTDALQQVQKKEKELGSGKGQLGAKIKLLVGDLKKLRTDKQADEAQALKKADF